MAKHEEVKKYIKIRKASEHNLKGIDIDIPRDEFVVLTDVKLDCRVWSWSPSFKRT